MLSNCWIPAFAGMTRGLGMTRSAGMTRGAGMTNNRMQRQNAVFYSIVDAFI